MYLRYTEMVLLLNTTRNYAQEFLYQPREYITHHLNTHTQYIIHKFINTQLKSHHLNHVATLPTLDRIRFQMFSASAILSEEGDRLMEKSELEKDEDEEEGEEDM